MFLKSKMRITLAALSLAASTQATASGLYITEWMYSGNGDEFVELTNLSGASVDFTNWSYDDESRAPLTFDLSGFGTVANGESVIFTEATAAQFKTDWNLGASVKVLGGETNNIGRNDEINIYGAFDGSIIPLIDRLTYGDGDFSGTIRTKEVSGRPSSMAALGANDVSLWELSQVGDIDGSYTSLNGDIGSPGSYVSAVPVPAAVWLFASGFAGLLGFRRASV